MPVAETELERLARLEGPPVALSDKIDLYRDGTKVIRDFSGTLFRRPDPVDHHDWSDRVRWCRLRLADLEPALERWRGCGYQRRPFFWDPSLGAPPLTDFGDTFGAERDALLYREQGRHLAALRDEVARQLRALEAAWSPPGYRS